MNNYFIKFFFVYFLTSAVAFSEVIKKIEVVGNERIPLETIKMFSSFSLNDDLKLSDLNVILKNLYETNFFENVNVEFKENVLTIVVKENPIIENITIEGVQANKIKKAIKKNLKLKPRSSFNDFLLKSDKDKILLNLRSLGYFFSDVDILMEELPDNKIDLIYRINLGNKSKIKKISFIGNKIFKDRKLRSVIVSEEFKFWKFISGKKYLNQDTILLDERLLKNFYLTKGYYDASVNSSFAKLIEDDQFELIFNIDAKEKFYFNNLSLKLPNDFNPQNFKSLEKLFADIKGKAYSINDVNKILKEIDIITTYEEYQSTEASVSEKIVSNKINLEFEIKETKKMFIQKINIFGNNITRESVIRNQFEIDEGDPYNEILQRKSINNLKNLNFFKNVKSEVIDGVDPNSKIINITVEEKPTGEISAGAGVGTSGGTVAFGVKENNYLGRGIGLQADATINEESIKGSFSVYNPNFQNSDKSVYASFEATETDRLADFGYKTNKVGFSLGTNFEYLGDFKTGLSTSTYYENIDTNSTASSRQKKQAGNYWDTFLGLDLDYDKRNQKFQTSDGFRSVYNLELPVISDTNTFSNTFNYKFFSELYDQNISTFSFYFKSANSLSNDDIKLSERLFIPSKRLRGFENGKIGPKDGKDFIGGNYVSSLNFTSTIPQLLENRQNLDVLLFLDAASVWGVDYDSSINEAYGSNIRSSIGIGVDWFTVIGPLNFSFAHPLKKEDNDTTESFRFNLGTTF